ncbi:prepilin-type N-terminal cleavage/methylation domain-containing protein [Lysobacter tyrosinilyticus]
MKRARQSHLQKGFSLLEVMIAVVILSFGLVALASLQAALIRSSAESKAQTVALSLAKERIEDLRTYQSLGGYQAINGLAKGSAESIDGDPSTAGTQSIGGVDYKRWWTVQRYAFDATANKFVDLGGAVTGATPTGYESNNEFKRVQVTVNWTDASGQERAVTMEDAIGAIDPSDSAKLGKLRDAVGPRKPRAMIFNPAATDGVIPIAIGNNNSTAATNPTPEVAGRNNNQQVVETRFDVLTYSGITGTTNKLAQARVETAVVGCTCDVTKGGGTAMRPTYWDGVRYTVPVAASYAAPAGVAVSTQNPQSELCTICCRDHHDNSQAAPNRVAAGSAKFDPWRSVHEHYVEGSVTATTGTIATGQYKDSCRIIRVDGLWRVAADLRNDHTDLLETAVGQDNVAEHSAVPSSAATNNYAGASGFVLNYMNARFVSTSSYNTPVAMTPSPALHPTSVSIEKTGDFKWQHARGLYVDYLEPVAIARLNKAKSDCAAANAQQSGSCDLQTTILAMLPFTSINLSEIASWKTFNSLTGGPGNSQGQESADQISVTNNEFKDALNQSLPVRGKVASGVNVPSANVSPWTLASILESNSGLALMPDPVDPAEFTPKTDRQDFAMNGGSSGGGNNGGTYKITFSNYTFSGSTAFYPTVVASPSATCNFATSGSTKPNPYSCASSNLNQATSITIGRYNYQDNSRTSTAALTCTGSLGDRAYSGSAYSVKYCKNYQIASASLSPTNATISIGNPLPTDGSINETTTLGLSNLKDADTLNLNMALQGETQTALTCTYTFTTKKGVNTYTYSVSAADCQ